MAEHGIDTLDIIQVKRCADRFSRLDFYDDVPNTSRVYLEARKMSLSELEAKISLINRVNGGISDEIAKNTRRGRDADLEWDVFLRAFRRQFGYLSDWLGTRASFLRVKERTEAAYEQGVLYPKTLIGGTDDVK